MFRSENSLNFRELCDQKPDKYNYLVFLFDVLSPAPLPEKYHKKKIDMDWDPLFAAASNTFVAPLLYQRIVDQQLSEYVPADFLESLRIVHELNGQRNSQLKNILEDALQILNEGGITPTLLKGSHALFGLLPYSSCRMMGDIDLLIPENQLTKARDLLMAKGYYHEGCFVKTDDPEDALQTDHAHIAPLFHPSGYGYLELHRHPNYQSKVPELVEYCFSQSSLVIQHLDNCKFYSLPTKYLFLYNQIHHYYGILERAEYPDIRYLVEQSMLLNEFGNNDLEDIYNLLKSMAPGFISPFMLQNALIRELLCFPIIEKYRELDSKNKKTYNKAILLLLSDKRTVTQQKLNAYFSLFFFLRKKLFDPEWCKSKLFNLAWYRKSLPQNLKRVLKYNWTLRR